MQTNSLLPPGAGPTRAAPSRAMPSLSLFDGQGRSIELLADAWRNFVMVDMQPAIEAFAELARSVNEITSNSQTITLDTVRAANRRHVLLRGQKDADGMRQVMTDSTAKRLNDDEIAVLRRERGGVGQARAERRPKRRPMATLRSDDTNTAGSRFNNAAAKDPAIENDRPSPAEATAHRLKSARRFKSLEL